MEDITIMRPTTIVRSKNIRLETVKRRNKTCEQTKSKEIMLIMVKHLFQLCLIFLMIMHDTSIMVC
jgi:hypothetical protein